MCLLDLLLAGLQAGVKVDCSRGPKFLGTEHHSHQFVAWLPWNVNLSWQHGSSRHLGLHRGWDASAKSALRLPEVSSLPDPKQSDEGRPRVCHFSRALTFQALCNKRHEQRLVQGGLKTQRNWPYVGHDNWKGTIGHKISTNTSKSREFAALMCGRTG